MPRGATRSPSTDSSAVSEAPLREDVRAVLQATMRSLEALKATREQVMLAEVRESASAGPLRRAPILDDVVPSPTSRTSDRSRRPAGRHERAERPPARSKRHIDAYVESDLSFATESTEVVHRAKGAPANARPAPTRSHRRPPTPSTSETSYASDTESEASDDVIPPARRHHDDTHCRDLRRDLRRDERPEPVTRREPPAGRREQALPASSTHHQVKYTSDFGRRHGIQLRDCARRPAPAASEPSSVDVSRASALSTVESRYRTEDEHYAPDQRRPAAREGNERRHDAPSRSALPSTRELVVAAPRRSMAVNTSAPPGADNAAELAACKETIEELAGQLQSLSAELARSTMQQKQRELDTETMVAGLRVQHHKELTQRTAELTEAKSRAVQEVSSTLTGRFEAESARLQDELGQARQQLQDTTRRFAAFKKDHGALKDKVSAHEESVLRLAGEADARNRKVEDLTRHLRDAKHFRKLAEDQLEARTKEVEEYAARLQSAERERADLHVKLRATNEAARAFEAKAEAELRRLSVMFDENRITHEERLAEAENRSTKCEKLKTKAKELRDELEDARKSLAVAMAERDDFARELRAAQEDLVAERSRTAELSESMHAALAAERETYQSFVKQTDDTLAAVHRDWEGRLEDLRGQCEKLDLALQHCQKEAEDERAGRHEAEHRHEDTALALEREREKARLGATMQDEKFAAYKQHTSETISSLKTQLKDRDRRMEQLAVLSTSNAGTIQTLRDQLAAERGRNATLETQMREVKGLARRVGENLQREVRRNDARSATEIRSSSRPSEREHYAALPLESQRSSTAPSIVGGAAVANGSPPAAREGTATPEREEKPRRAISAQPEPIRARNVIHTRSTDVSVVSSGVHEGDADHAVRMSHFQEGTAALIRKIADDGAFRDRCVASVRALDYRKAANQGDDSFGSETSELSS